MIDVAVIGGGFAGLATAWGLARRGVAATVFERESEIGTFASGRGAGLGRQLAEDDETSALTIRGAAILREQFPQAWRPTGGILSFDDAALCDSYIARAARFGIPVEVLDHAGLLERWPAMIDLPVARALFVPSDGVIDVKALIAGYAADISIVRGMPVTAVGLLTDAAIAHARANGANVGPGSIAITTPAGVTIARVIVDAAGAWAGNTVGDPPLFSYKRHLFTLDVAPTSDTVPFLWHLGARELYVRGDDAAVLASPCDAARIEPTDQQPDLVGESHLRTVLEMVAPDLAEATITRRWACHRSYTETRKMRLGRDSDRPWLVWAAGLGGHGATASGAVGETVADAVIAALG